MEESSLAKILLSLGLTAGGALIALAVKHFLDNPLREIAFKVPWLRVKGASLAGYWQASYDLRESGEDSSQTAIKALYQLIEWPGSLVLIRELRDNETAGVVVIKARKRDSYLTGTYENAAEHDTLHGVFQLHINPRGWTMSGRFVGFSADNPSYINVGTWTWSRLTSKAGDDALVEARDKLWKANNPSQPAADAGGRIRASS